MNTRLIALTIGALVVSLGCAHEAPQRHARRDAHTSGSEHPHAARGTAAVETDHATTEVAAAPTAFDQSEAPDDMEITRSIRAAIVSDSALTFSAANCTIITSGAVVTLRGDVGTVAERNIIDQHAHAAPGVVRVDNQLRVAD